MQLKSKRPSDDQMVVDKKADSFLICWKVSYAISKELAALTVVYPYMTVGL